MGKVIHYGDQPTMSVPIPCPHGCGLSLKLDLRRTHQHMECDRCHCEFCFYCPELPSIVEAEEMAIAMNQSPEDAIHGMIQKLHEKRVDREGPDLLHSFLRA